MFVLRAGSEPALDRMRAFAMLEGMAKHPKRPRDVNQLAKSIVDDATLEGVPPAVSDKKNEAAVALGRLGGLKGGKARAKSLTAEERSAIARKAASSRWQKPQK